MTLRNEELLKIKGGAGISGTLLNSIAKLVETLYETGKQVGQTLFKIYHKNYC